MTDFTGEKRREEKKKWMYLYTTIFWLGKKQLII
jgi:hypothetical protein